MQNSPDSHEMSRLRDLAQMLIARGAPVEFSRAVSDCDLAEIYSLRAKVVRDKALPNTVSYEMQDVDEYDDSAVHIQGRLNKCLVASARVVFPTPSRRLPVEVSHKADLGPHGDFAEIGRTIVVPGAVSKRTRVFVGLLGYSLQLMVEQGFRKCAATASPSMVRLYQRMGLRLTHVGAKQLVGGVERHSVVFDVAASAHWLAQESLSDRSRKAE